MTDTETELVFEFDLEAPPEKVWRALSIPEYLEQWLQPPADLDLTVISAEENRRLTYRWRETGADAVPGHEDSTVTFELTPDGEGGTRFRLTHAPLPVPSAANSNEPVAMLRLAA